MRTLSLIAVAWLASCASRPVQHGSTRARYLISDHSTLDGVSTAGAVLEISRHDRRVFFVRQGSESPLNEGFGWRVADRSYAVVFYRFPRNDVALLVWHGDGRGVRMFNQREAGAIQVQQTGHDFVLRGSGFDGASVQLRAGGVGILVDRGVSLPVVFGRFGGDVVVAFGWEGAATEIAVGRYDFERGRGDNAGPQGQGSERFAAR